MRIWPGTATLALLLFSCAAVAADEGEKDRPQAGRPQRIEVHLSNYRFDPDLIVLRKDVPVELLLKNDSALSPHDFVVEDPAMPLKAEVKPYASTVLSFTPTVAGEFRFACKKKLLFMKSHERRGMHGILRVEDGAAPRLEKPQLEKPGEDSDGPGGSR